MGRQQQYQQPSKPDPIYIPAPSQHNKPPIIIYQGVRPPVHVYEKPQPKPQYQQKSDKQELPYEWVPKGQQQGQSLRSKQQEQASSRQQQPQASLRQQQPQASLRQQQPQASSRQTQTVRGKPQEQGGARNTKLVDIPSPDLSLNLNSNSLSRSITVTSSQSEKVFAGPKTNVYSSPKAQARIDASEQSFENKDRSAVVRAVVSVSDSNGKLIRRGTVTDITNE